MTEQLSNYENEYISAEEAKHVYNRRFRELMALADAGRISRKARPASDSDPVSFVFRRGDIIALDLNNG